MNLWIFSILIWNFELTELFHVNQLLLIYRTHCYFIESKEDLETKLELYKKKVDDVQDNNTFLKNKLNRIMRYMKFTGIEIEDLKKACETGVLSWHNLKVEVVSTKWAWKSLIWTCGKGVDRSKPLRTFKLKI